MSEPAELFECPHCGRVADTDDLDCMGADVDNGYVFCNGCNRQFKTSGNEFEPQLFDAPPIDRDIDHT